MRLDKIKANPSEFNRRLRVNLGGDGIIWFCWQSYHYINPIGFKPHLQFLWDLPGALIRYSRLMKT